MVLLQSGFLANEAAGGGEPNNSHQLASALPVPVSSAVALSRPCAGGWGFALAAASDHIYAWGVNQATILAKAGGNEDGADPSTLDKVAEGVTAAAAGFDHGLLVSGGKVLVFGPAFRPPVAAPGLHLSPVPFKVAITQVAAGEAWHWGVLYQGAAFGGPIAVHRQQVPSPSAACPLQPPPQPCLPWPGLAGEHHSLALAANGDVYAWGSNQEGQLGDGSSASSAVPLLVAGPSSQQRDGGLLQPVTAIACGARHSAAINALGQCLAWGWSLHGQCGGGRAAPSQPSPTLVKALGPLKCTGVAAGMGHTVVCTDQGDAYAWGLNGDGQLGDATDASSLEVRPPAGRPLPGWQAGCLAACLAACLAGACGPLAFCCPRC